MNYYTLLNIAILISLLDIGDCRLRISFLEGRKYDSLLDVAEDIARSDKPMTLRLESDSSATELVEIKDKYTTKTLRLVDQVIRAKYPARLFRWNSRRGWTEWSICRKGCIEIRHRRCRKCRRRRKEIRRCKKPHKRHCSKNVSARTSIATLIYEQWSAWTDCQPFCWKTTSTKKECKSEKQRISTRFALCQSKDGCPKENVTQVRRCPGNGLSSYKRTTTVVPVAPGRPDILADGSSTTKCNKKRCRISSAEKRLHETGEKCGVRSSQAMYRIVNGNVTNHWPWQVAMVRGRRGSLPFCGGTLIHPQWVLTAAHCVAGKRSLNQHVRFIMGASDFDKPQHSVMRSRYDKVVPHPRWRRTDLRYDIALVRLKYSQSLNGPLNIACLPSPNLELPAGTECRVIGWGKLHENDDVGPNRLHEATVPLVSSSDCSKSYKDKLGNFQICAGHKEGGPDACAGDSGGPLLCRVIHDRNTGPGDWHIYGVTSFGEGCGKARKYGVYTKVSQFSKWIWKTISSSPENI